MPRKLYTLLPPKPGQRKFWTVQLRIQAGKRMQRSTRNATRAAAQQFAHHLLKQEAPHLIDQPRTKLAKL